MSSHLAPGLARWLSERAGHAIRVENLEPVSAGARRVNALFDAVDPGGGRERLAVTALPTLDIQQLPVTVEASVRSLARAAGVATPRIVGASEDSSYVGGPFFVSDRVDGETIPRRVLRLVEQHQIGDLLATQLGAAMAALHAIDPVHAPPELPRPVVGPVQTALESADAHLQALLQPSPVFSYGLRWLEEHRPAEPAAQSIVHNDIRNGNLIVGPDGLRAILDWEGCRIGDPAEDLAWPLVRMWRFRSDDLMVGGFAPLDPYRRAYRANGGTWHDERVRWWLVLGTLRWGLGLADQAAQHLNGKYRNIVMAASGRRVTELEYDTLLAMRS